MNAFAASAAALHGDANLAADATYTPKSGVVVELRVADGQGVVLGAGDDAHRVLDTGFRRSVTRVSVPQAALPDRPVDGGRLQVGSRLFNIRASQPDTEGVCWMLDVDEIVQR